MRTAVTTARSLLGLIFIVYGVNYFIPFVSLPAPNAEGQAFIDAFAATGYFLPLLRITQIVCGVALLAGKFVPLALVVLAPIVVNILLFDLVLDPRGLAMGVLLVVLEGFLGWAYRDEFERLLRP